MFFILLTILAKIQLLNIEIERHILVKINKNETLKLACSSRGFKPTIATSENFSNLLNLLKKQNIFSGYVSGWNGSDEELVLSINGSLAPFELLTNETQYIFCTEHDKIKNINFKKHKTSNNRILNNGISKNKKEREELKPKRVKQKTNLKQKLNKKIKKAYLVVIPCYKVSPHSKIKTQIHKNNLKIKTSIENVNQMVKLPISNMYTNNIETVIKSLEKLN